MKGNLVGNFFCILIIYLTFAINYHGFYSTLNHIPTRPD
jgi:hypothetical protein